MKSGKFFLKILSFFFTFYVAIVISYHSGYYEKRVYEKTLMTEEEIRRFESDVENNLPVDVISYLPQKKDYSNIYTKSAVRLSNWLSDFLDLKIRRLFKTLKSLFIG